MLIGAVRVLIEAVRLFVEAVRVLISNVQVQVRPLLRKDVQVMHRIVDTSRCNSCPCGVDTSMCSSGLYARCRHLQEQHLHLLLLSIPVQVLIICFNTFKIKRKTSWCIKKICKYVAEGKF